MYYISLLYLKFKLDLKHGRDIMMAIGEHIPPYIFMCL